MVALITPPAAAAMEAQQPLVLGQHEKVAVRMRLIDATVVDELGRTVPGLSKDDFEVLVGGVEQPLETFDVRCSVAPTPDVRPVRSVRRRERTKAPDVARRIVLVLDYPHLGTHERAFVLEDLMRMVRHGKTPREEVMIVALAGTVRVEQPFTSDGEELLRSLRRMNRDISLWLPSFQAFSGRALLHALTALVDGLESLDGAKALVLYSKLGEAPGALEGETAAIVSAAQDAGVTFYPVYVLGMGDPPTGGAPWLARLAAETGGRFLLNTLDLTLGYAQAQRDLSCRYTLGFYVPEGSEDRTETVEVRTRDPGLAAIHPGVSTSRSPEARRESHLRSAFYYPEPFWSSDLRGDLFRVRPRSKRAWEALLALEFRAPGPVGSKEDGVVDFGGVLLRSDVAVFEFQRRLTVRGGNPSDDPDRVVSFRLPLDLVPGAYTLVLVVAEPGEERPRAARVVIEVPPVPLEGLYIVGPMLGGAGEPAIVVRGDRFDPIRDRVGSGMPFRPVLTGRVRSPAIVRAEAEICGRSPIRASKRAVVRRELKDQDGTTIRSFGPLPLRKAPAGGVRCRGLADTFPTGTLEPAGYVFEVWIESRDGERIPPGECRFVVEAATGSPKAPRP